MPERIIEQATNGLGWVIGAAGLAWSTWRKLSAREARKQESGLQRAIEEHRKKLEHLEAQTRPNGGSSMKDDLTSIKAGMATLLGEVASIRKQLVMQRAMTRLVFDLDDQITWEAGPDGRVNYMSAAIERWIGRTPEQMRGEDWRNSIHDDDAERVFRVWADVIQRRRRLEMSFRLVGEEGQVVHVDAYGGPQFDERSSEFTGWVGYMTKVTQ